MDRYRIKYWCEDGSEGYIGFDSLEMAVGFYESMEGEGPAELQQYIEERHCYEAIIYPEFEY
ncbi:MAG TPA: hypothetical protein DCZ91_18210 [Lachnospiraceae bacterium]|nr:hypothetical protein [Lachnospiraceae bacterium]